MTLRLIPGRTRRLPALAVLSLVLAGCTRSAPAPDAAMADMPGMAGMAMPGDSGVALDRAAAARLGIRFARAAIQQVGGGIRLAGTLRYAEPRRVYVSARTDGWVERLDADFLVKPVGAGEVLLTIYSPELVNGQEEYLAARRLGDAALLAAARRRLALWNVAEAEITELDRSGTPRRAVEIRAPRAGEIAEKLVTEGQSVRAGDNLFLIADRSALWVEAAVFEMDAPMVVVGAPVMVTVGALPGRRYPGRVVFLQPELDEATRTLTARIEVANRDGGLRPGMYATVEVTAAGRSALAVPLESVLPTGTVSLVFVNRGDGTFLPRPVVTGARGDSLIEIRLGLRTGDEVLASATYLLDSETNLAAAMQGLMLQMGMGLEMGGMGAAGATDSGRAP